MASSRSIESQALAEPYPISIIIPAHNSEKYLASCLQALMLNDLTECQILLVNDSSTDRTADIAGEFPFVEVIHQASRQGPAAARNRGAELARCPYLLFLDADVLLPPNSIFWMRESLELYSHRSDIAGVLGCYSENLPDDGFLTHYKNLTTCFLYRVTETQSPFLHTPIFMVRREILEQGGGFDPSLEKAEDFKLGLALGSKGFRFVIDRRIQGIHLKKYALSGLLKEDWERIRALRALSLTPEERRFAYKAHRWKRLFSVLFPMPVVALLLIGSLWGLLLLALFYLLNYPLFRYLRRRRGLSFGVGSMLFLFLEMLWAQLALASSILGKGAGRRVGAVRST